MIRAAAINSITTTPTSRQAAADAAVVARSIPSLIMIYTHNHLTDGISSQQDMTATCLHEAAVGDNVKEPARTNKVRPKLRKTRPS